MSDAPTFALIGGNGHIGKRHGKAIKEVGGRVVLVVDPNPVAGWLDSDWIEAKFIREQFTLLTIHNPLWPSDLDYVVVLSPNGVHAQHAILGLRETNVICEKPLALKPRQLKRMAWAESQSGHTLSTILQLRHQSGAIAAKAACEGKTVEAAEITYYASRGHWYSQTWKGQQNRSGGLIFNIGSHPVDIATWIFGKPGRHWIESRSESALDVVGEFGSTMVRIRLSTNERDVVRSLDIDGIGTFDLSESFTNLHAECYRDILAGRGLGVTDVADSVEWCRAVADAVVM